ncbi:hypothetical protein LXA43DRAFT_1097849 [Ganoderma leucocontextum]|nr:hypothetical protein LXA43DRAFT_1097849 [Ganoderma leucocontextum]
MPSPKQIPMVPKDSLDIAAESMRKDVERFAYLYVKSEPMEQHLPSVVEREPHRQPTREYNLERVAVPDPTRAPECNTQLIFEDLPYTRYETARQLDSTSSLASTNIYFRVGGPKGDAFPLSNALSGHLDTLFEGNESAPLADASAKLSIRLLFHGCEPYTRQIMARRATARSEHISMSVLAHKIAKETEKCLKRSVLANPLCTGAALYCFKIFTCGGFAGSLQGLGSQSSK